MPFEAVYPHDTEKQIFEFVGDNYVGRATQDAALDAIDAHIELLCLNPTLGATPVGTPFETRRVYRFQIEVAESVQTVEFMYKINRVNQTLSLLGFRRVVPLF
jgi:hypothetical protein